MELRAIGLLCLGIAWLGAFPAAGGWNDGSRLASIESLGEHGTFQIDESIFVRVPPVIPGEPHPYAASAPGARLVGTLDKLRIDGHYYSDKSPVLSVVAAGPYWLWRSLGGPSLAERPDLGIRMLTFLLSGSAYLLAVLAIHRLGTLAGVDHRTKIFLTLSFALATVAPAYARTVNNHIVLLAIVAWLCVSLAELQATGEYRWQTIRAGFLCGMAYTVDLAAGPLLAIVTAIYLGIETGRFSVSLLFSLAAAPWLLAHHSLNYAIGGTFGPANAVPEYLAWPGSPFTAETMTGGLKHTVGGFLTYGLDLLFGQKGIISNNLPLWLACAAAARMLWSPHDPRELRIVLFALGWCGAVWSVYALSSNNFSGQCVSVRWFVPFLAPGYWVLALFLARHREYRHDLLWLSAVGAILAGFQFAAGTWMPRMVPGLWGWLALAGIGWFILHRRRAASTSLATWPVSQVRWQPHKGITKRSSSVG